MMYQFELNAPDVIADRSDEDIVLINLRNGFYYRIGGVAAEVFELLIGQRSSIDQGMVSENVITLFAHTLLEKDLIRGDGSVPSKRSDQDLAESGLLIEEFSDLEDLLGLDPIHEVSPTAGWPVKPQQDD